MDKLGDPLTTRPIRMGWEFTMGLCPSWQFRIIDSPDRQVGNSWGLTPTQTRSDGPEPFLTLTTPAASEQLIKEYNVQFVIRK